MRRKPVPIIDVEELRKWPTKRLLGRLNSLRILEESPEVSDMNEAEVEQWSAEGIGFKNDVLWVVAHGDIKSILSGREHLE